jgi:thiol-disulfide isomerase/thioredoxin
MCVPWRITLTLCAAMGAAVASERPAAEEALANIEAILQAEPPGKPGQKSADGEPPDMNALDQWLAGQARRLREQGMAFYDNYPDDPRRWGVVAQMLSRRAWWLTPDYQPKDEAAANWLRQLESLRAALNASKTASARAREQAAATDVREAMMFAAHPARAHGDGAIQDMIDDLARRFPEGDEPLLAQKRLLQQLSYGASFGAGQQPFDAILKRARNSPHAGIRRLAEGQYRLIAARQTPVQMRFTALDGREIDLARLRGKVVLVEFWATWCRPCLEELPNLKRLYERYHEHGLEIVGISLDETKDRGKLENLVVRKAISWPQHFDGQGRGNRFAIEYGVTGIPMMLLLNREGLLVSTTLRGKGLASKVEELLAVDRT